MRAWLCVKRDNFVSTAARGSEVRRAPANQGVASVA
jgi:hypothetical protein